jgi:hypothetical protein
VRQQALLRQRFLLSGSFEFYEKLKRVAGADWLPIRQELADTLQTKGERHKLAAMLALDKDSQALAKLLETETDIRQIQRFESVFLPDEQGFVLERYITLLGDYLSDHFGQPAAAYVRQQLSVLLQKGEPELVREIIQALIARFPDRPSLPEELAELFPKTKKRVLL